MPIPNEINSGSVKGDGLAQRIHYWRTHMEELPGGPVSETITLPDGESVVVSSPKLEKDAYAIAYGIVEYFLDSSNFKNDDRMHPPNNSGGGS